MENLAHYDKKTNRRQLLREHLINVGNACRDRVPPTVKFGDISNRIVKALAYAVGAFHDIGKYTLFFQQYLQLGKYSAYKTHAHISALYIYMILMEELEEVEEENRPYLLLIAYICVKYHHKSLDNNMLSFGDYCNAREWEGLKKQWEDLFQRKDIILKELEILGATKIEQGLEKLRQAEKIIEDAEFTDIAYDFGRVDYEDPKWYFLLIYIFSLLIDSDKLDSAEIAMDHARLISAQRVEDYLATKSKGHDLVTKKEKARQSIIKTVSTLTEEELKTIRFFPLTAPTGIGKTLSSLQAVLLLQEQIYKLEEYVPRVITAIPFVNIIEQNKKEYANVIKDEGRMIIHHRLNDFSKLKPRADKSLEDTRVENKLLEVESWEGDFVLTTFVQLFQSIFTGKNRLLKKFHRLAGSIVILDEAQSINEEYMPVVGATLIKLSEYLGTRFVLMTATQPKLLDFGKTLLNNEKIIQRTLLPDYEDYFKDLNRTKLVPLLDPPLSQEEFIQLFFDKWKGDQSALIVVNTINRSIKVYQDIKVALESSNINIPVYYLSTNIISTQREKVIREVRELLDHEKPVILVSTQTIEAGVDVDFHMGFRDLAPIDSIVQTAGRINREGQKGTYLPLYIVRIEKDNRHVYNIFKQLITEGLVNNQGEIKEEDYGALAERFYNEILQRNDAQASLDVWEKGILKLDMEKVESFKLIDVDTTEDIFVEIDEKASLMADMYEKVYRDEKILDKDLRKIFGGNHRLANLVNDPDQYGKKSLLKLIKNQMSRYMIQIRVEKLINNRPPQFSARSDGGVFSEMYWIPPGEIHRYYDETMGFKTDNKEAYIY